jgi:SAM-dependent methyltransferase
MRNKGLANLGYNESPDTLDIRIRAHTQYSSLRVEDILEELIIRYPTKRILDVGCGSGNYSELFARHCFTYVGLDKNTDLLEQAQQKCQKLKLHNTLFVFGDMNDEFVFMPGSFNLVFYGYSAYYVDDAGSLIRRSKSILTSGGTLCLVGPIPGNAIELDLVSKALYGVSSSDEKEIRLGRLQKEFLPLIKEEFGECKVLEKEFSLIFPSAAEYAKYYLATPQYIELARHSGELALETVQVEIERLSTLKLTKKAVFLVAHKT